jgi:hypothetical protein
MRRVQGVDYFYRFILCMHVFTLTLIEPVKYKMLKLGDGQTYGRSSD